MESTREASKIILPLVEKFYSVQGEGYNAGHAAFFVRFAGCNLDCIFADGSRCDTPWQHAQEKVSLEDVGRWLNNTWEDHLTVGYQNHLSNLLDHEKPNEGGTPVPIVILTGGEPTMSPAFDDVVTYIRDEVAFPVAVESNGTKYRAGLEEVDWLVVSPKNLIAHGNPLGSSAPDPVVLSLAHEFRWVIAGRESPVPPIIENSRDPEYYLSPALCADGTGTEWHDPNYTPRFATGAVERCLEIIQADPRWRLSLQTHKWLRVR